MPSSSTSDWADRIRKGLRDHEGSRSGPPAPSGAALHASIDEDRLGEIALEWGLIDAACLEACRRDRDDARRGGKDILLEAILVGRGSLRGEDVDRLRLERDRQLYGTWTSARYELRRPLGEGTSAIVFRAWDRELKREVALKVLREGAALSSVARDRFRREGESLAGLSHPHVLTLYDAGVTNEGRFYQVLEIVDGPSLREVLTEGHHDERARVALIEKVARGVAAAHARGIIHRDLKPANILVSSSGDPKVGDFGLAHLMDSAGDLTRTGTPLGTPLYMSPEQVSGRRGALTPRTDIYALGAILYEAVVGRPPHGGETISEIYQKVIHEEPLAPRRVNPGIARDLETIIVKAIDKDSAKRYTTAEAFAEDLSCYLKGESIAAQPISAGERLWRKGVKHRAILLWTLIAVVLGFSGWMSALRTPATRGKVLFIERLEGDIRVIEDGQSVHARKGQILGRGGGIESGASPSLALLRVEDGTQVEIGPDSSVRTLLVEPIRISLSKGSLRAEVPAQVREGPLVLRTPYGEVRGKGTRFRTLLDTEAVHSLRIDVEEGEVELRRSTGAGTVVRSGYSAVWAADAPPVFSRFALLDLGEGVRTESIFINPGTFTMGSADSAREMPRHRVTLSKGYYLGKNKVTRGQFAAFVKATGYRTDAEKEEKAYCRVEGGWKEVAGASWRDPKFFTQTDDHPALCISWNDATAFCDWAAKKSGRGVRLPTEAEWEFACRAGTDTRWSFGNAEELLRDHAWTNGNSGLQTQPIGRKKPNPWGFFDMHGNVWEWCRDYAAPYSGEATDPSGPENGDRRCLRGGSWADGPEECRSAFRNETPPSARNTNNGFRVAFQ